MKMQTSKPNYLPRGEKLFEGEYREVMPAIIEAGLVPASPSWVMEQRNKSAGTNNQDSLWNIYWDTDCGLAGDSKKVYLFPHSKELRKITPDTKLTGSGIANSDISKAVIYSRADLKLNETLTEEEARKHPIWQELAGSQKRLDSYVENAFRLGKDKFNYDKMMGVYAPDDEVQRAVVLLWLNNRSNANGDRFLGNFNARLVGVRSGVREAHAPAKQAAQKNPVSELEKICRKAGITSTDELRNALKLYNAAKKLNI